MPVGTVLLESVEKLTRAPDAKRDVVIAFCHNGTVTTPFMQSCVEAMNYDSLHERRIRTVSMAQSPYIPDARSTICDQFLSETDCSWLWFVDTDVQFPRNALDLLLSVADRKERAIIGGYYLVRYDDGIATVWLTVVPETYALHPIRDVPSTGLVKVASVGMGCTIIHRDVLEAIAADNTDDSWTYFSHDLVENAGKVIRLGEDVTFCLRAKQVGYSAWGLADLRCEHYKVQPLTREANYESLRSL